MITNLDILLRTALPMTFDDSITGVELLGKVVAKVNECIAALNTYTSTDISDLVDTIITGLVDDGTIAAMLDVEALQAISDVAADVLALSISEYVNVKTAGAVGDGVLRSIATKFPAVLISEVQALNAGATLNSSADWFIIQKAINAGGKVFIPVGTYWIDIPLVIDNTDNTLIISGIWKQSHIKVTTAINAFEVNATCKIENLVLDGYGGASLDGILVNSSCIIDNVDIGGFGGYGINLSDTAVIVSQHISNCSIGHNIAGGIYGRGNTTYQKNYVVIRENYIVGSGGDADDATPATGHGIYIDGCVAWSIIQNVIETSTGAGLFIKGTAGYGNYGLVVEGNHFEQNKYANIYFDNDLGNNQDIIIKGNYYYIVTNFTSGLTLAGGARTIVKNPLRLVTSEIDSRMSLDLFKQDLKFAGLSNKVGGEFENITAFHHDNVVFGDAGSDHFNGIRLNQALGENYQESEEFATFIDTTRPCKLRLNYRYTKSSSTSAQLLLLPLGWNKAYLGSPIALTLSSDGTWKVLEYVIPVSSFPAGTKYLQANPVVNGTLDGTDELFISRIYLDTVDAVQPITFASSARPIGAAATVGMMVYDTTVGKPVWYAGSDVWKDAAGTTV